MTKVSTYIALIFVLMSAACVERLDFSIGDLDGSAIVVEGFITNEDGPYEIRVSKAYNIDSAAITRSPINVKKMTISDNLGNTEELEIFEKGVYHTRKDGIHGKVGRAYTLRVELHDGRVYETVPDSMFSTGMIDEITHEFVKVPMEGKPLGYAFDMYINAKGAESTANRFLWKMEYTYQIETQPWDHMTKHSTLCPPEDDCIDPLYCSSYEIDTPHHTVVTAKPPRGPRECTCCKCWITLDRTLPTISESIVSEGRTFQHIKIGQIPVTAFTMKSTGTYVSVRQFSLSQQAFDFWKLVRAQKDGVNSLFQPVNGKIGTNWRQIEGNPGTMLGIFYAAAVHEAHVRLRAEDVPDVNLIPKLNQLYPFACYNYDPLADSVRPDFWDPEW